MKTITVLAATLCMMTLSSCGAKKDAGSEAPNTADFYAEQPLPSGIYVADRYDITGENARKGRFDGRVYFSLAPDNSAIFVDENGNRTKIRYTLTLSKPFAPADSGKYVAKDSRGLEVIVAPGDSATYQLTFEKGESTIRIDFDSIPKTKGSPLEILEQINKAIN